MKIILIMLVVVITILAEYVILTGRYDILNTTYEKLPNVVKDVVVKKGKKCEMKGQFFDYMGRPLKTTDIDCTRCVQYMSKDDDGYCRTMQYNGATCSRFGGPRPCPKEGADYSQYKKL